MRGHDGAAILVVAASGCFGPAYEECRLACSSEEDCEPGHACSAAHMCTASTDPLACGPPPVPPPAASIGMYDFALTNRENGCILPDWNAGSTSNVGVKITEDRSVLTAEPQGSMATTFMSWLGAHVFLGVDLGPRVELVLRGERPYFKDSCAYTFDVTIKGMLDGDLLEGGMYFRARTNGSWTCGGLNGCMSRKALRGTRSAP